MIRNSAIPQVVVVYQSLYKSQFVPDKIKIGAEAATKDGEKDQISYRRIYSLADKCAMSLIGGVRCFGVTCSMGLNQMISFGGNSGGSEGLAAIHRGGLSRPTGKHSDKFGIRKSSIKECITKCSALGVSVLVVLRNARPQEAAESILSDIFLQV